MVGCNDDLFSKTTASSSGSITSEQRQKKRETAEFMRKTLADGKAELATICSSSTPLKRAALPSTVTWNGRCGKDFEVFIDRVTGHVAQQSHMGYLLLDKVAQLWLKYGSETVVLKCALKKKIHPSLHHISPSQFICDVVWLYGALQQSITGRGKAIIRDQEDTQDGILTWKRFIDTYRFHGDVDVYLAEQQSILTRKYHAHYHGGMIQFLEDFESAFMNIDYVLKRTSLSS